MESLSEQMVAGLLEDQKDRESCDHQDDYGSAIWTSHMCILCSREIPWDLKTAKRIYFAALENDYQAREKAAQTREKKGKE